MPDQSAARPAHKLRWAIGAALVVVLVVTVVVIAVNSGGAPDPSASTGTMREVAAPEGTPLTVTRQGVSQVADGGALSYAFVLGNSSDLMAQETRVDVQGLDSSGQPVQGAKWTVVVERIAGNGVMAFGDEIRDAAVSWDVGAVMGLSAAVRDTQAWWAEDGSVTAEFAFDPKASFEFEPDIQDSEHITVTTTRSAAVSFQANITVVFSDGVHVLGACRGSGMALGSEMEWSLRGCHVPVAADRNLSEFYVDAPWNDPRLPTPYPTES